MRERKSRSRKTDVPATTNLAKINYTAKNILQNREIIGKNDADVGLIGNFLHNIRSHRTVLVSTRLVISFKVINFAL